MLMVAVMTNTTRQYIYDQCPWIWSRLPRVRAAPSLTTSVLAQVI